MSIALIVIAVICGVSVMVYEYGIAGTAIGCRMRGGEWTRYGLPPKPVCLMKTKDAGKSCTDSSQCQGACVNYGPNLTRGQKAKGECTAKNIVIGCFTSIKDGKAEMSLCVD